MGGEGAPARCEQAGIARAQSRVVLVSLYLGTNDHERRLVASLRDALATKPALRVVIVLDALRALRGHAQGASSVAFLAPLLAQFGPERVSLHLYHTPDLHGVLKRVLPDRFNEVVGLQHVKAYLFDDDVILSGCVSSPPPASTCPSSWTSGIARGS